LLYVACLEGKVEIVEFLLKKGLNGKIKSKAQEYEFETPLQVAARWNYINIVKLLLGKVDYSRSEIEICLKTSTLKPPTIAILKNKLKDMKKKKGCSCF
jgi:hypothetical protein